MLYLLVIFFLWHATFHENNRKAKTSCSTVNKPVGAAPGRKPRSIRYPEQFLCTNPLTLPYAASILDKARE
jgi:hypothetical protein